MSKNKLTPLEVVERYHKKYLEYEKAFNKNPYSEKEMQEKIAEIAQSGIDLDSEEFVDKMIEAVVDNPRKSSDVSNAAFKFVLFTDFYLLTQKEELPENILKDYNALPIKEEIKPYFSIENGEFVKNEEKEISDDMKNFFKEVIYQTRIQQK